MQRSSCFSMPRLCGLMLLVSSLFLSHIAAAVVPVPSAVCKQTGTPIFSGASVSASNATIFPSSSLSVTVTGATSTQVTGGTYNLLVTGATSSVVLSEAFGSLADLITPLPVPAGKAESFSFDWKSPDIASFNALDTEVIMQLQAVTETFEPIVCLQITFESYVPVVPDEPKSTSKLLGYMCALISVFFFGTNFLPVKAYDTGDGVFFQWMMAIGIWLTGFVVQLIRGSPPFEPLALLGGMMWAIGNISSVPIIQMIGLGIGMSIWGTGGLVVGWAGGRFGWLGVHPQKVDNDVMNVLGVILCVGAMVTMVFVRTVKEEALLAAGGSHEHDRLKSTEEDHPVTHDRHSPLGEHDVSAGEFSLTRKLNHVSVDIARGGNGTSSASPDGIIDRSHSPNEGINHGPGADHSGSKGDSWIDRLSPGMRRFLGFFMACAAGTLYGLNFSPPQYLIDSGKGGSSHGIDYVFSHFCGILVTSTSYLVAYAIYRRNAPQVMGNIVVPGLLSGAGWGIAQISWFVANDQIHFVGTFPLVSCGPGIVATLCAIFFYKEIQGKRNFALLAFAAAVMIIGVIMIAFSLPSGS